MPRLEIPTFTFETARIELGYDSSQEFRNVLNKGVRKSLDIYTRTRNVLLNENLVFIGDVVSKLIRRKGNSGDNLYTVNLVLDCVPSYSRVKGAGNATIVDLEEGLRKLDSRLKLGIIMPMEEWYAGP